MRYKKRLILLLFSLAILAGSVGYAVFADLPSIDAIPEHLGQPSLRITDRNRRPLYEVLPADGGRHAVLALTNIATCMKQASIAVEDRNFYENPGVDAEGILRALWINLQGGETLSGGSTITQQVARSLLLQDEMSERSLRRKLRESVLAWQLARAYSKDDILALYLNQTFYGGFAYGVDAAARTYFGKPASELLLPECALLAGLPQAPALYNPFDHPDAAKERQTVVLGLMEKNGFISADERQQAGQAPLSYNSSPYPIRAPHFVWMVKNQVDELIRSGQLDSRSSLVVRASLDLDAQGLAEAAVARQMAKFKSGKGLDQHVNNAAVVVMDARKGEILALVGSSDYFNAAIFGAINMATAPRQPGSAFKPFIYAEAFNPLNPAPWNAATPILDVQTVFPTGSFGTGVPTGSFGTGVPVGVPGTEGQSYIPKNYDEREHGPVSARVALASSLNIPAVATLQKVGVATMTRLATRLGISSLGDDPAQYDLSLALGGRQMSLLELTGAYAALANRGFLPGQTMILEIQDADGNLVYRPPASAQPQVFDPRVAWLVSDILSDDNARMIGFGKNSTLKIERPAAVKTGTTTNFHDNWTVGYTPGLVVGVWVGNSDYQAMREVNGLTGAAPIWQETLRGLLRGKAVEPFTRPDGMVQREVCALSGLLPTLLCGSTTLEWFLDGTQPTRTDNISQQIWLDSETGAQATQATPASRRQPLTVLDLPAAAQRWARSQGLNLLSDFTTSPKSSGTACQANCPETQPAALVLVSPLPGRLYTISDKLALSAQQLPFEALAGVGVTFVTLWVDGRQVGSFDAPPYVSWWPLAEGSHRFWAQALTNGGQTIKSEVVEIVVSK